MVGSVETLQQHRAKPVFSNSSIVHLMSKHEESSMRNGLIPERVHGYGDKCKHIWPLRIESGNIIGEVSEVKGEVPRVPRTLQITG